MMKKKFEKIIQTFTDDHIKKVEKKSYFQRTRNNDHMNPIKHVAIIMDGNGRWGIKK